MVCVAPCTGQSIALRRRIGSDLNGDRMFPAAAQSTTMKILKTKGATTVYYFTATAMIFQGWSFAKGKKTAAALMTQKECEQQVHGTTQRGNYADLGSQRHKNYFTR